MANMAETDWHSKNRAIITSFGIVGLHGNKNVSFNSSYLPSILIAKNGSGKTTLLGAMNAILTEHYVRLLSIDFDHIYMTLVDIEEPILFYKSDVEEAFSTPTDAEFLQNSARFGVSPSALLRFIVEDFISIDESVTHENSTYNSILRSFDYRRVRLHKFIEDARGKIFQRSLNFYRSYQIVREAVADYDILYLPTYRRVELALRDDKPSQKMQRKKPQFEIAENSLFTGEIQFGLADITERLSELNEQIAFTSNSEYRRISAAIINDFLDGTFDRHVPTAQDIPTREDLRVMFSRVESSANRHYGPNYPVNIPNIEKLYGGGTEDFKDKFLNYFLTQLNRVINSTKIVEGRAEQFVAVCNSYFSLEDESTMLGGGYEVKSADSKYMELDRKNLSVGIYSGSNNKPIRLNSLSSGEKQMVSLFAKLFLYEKKKIVLIDEPELSLSLEWQRKILVDVVRSPLCSQMIAITHSPFVFDNELDPFAGSLKTSQAEIIAEDLDLFQDDESFEISVF